MNLNGKTLFISGGSRGIGLAIAKRAAADGANVAIAAKTAEPHPNLPGTIFTAAAEIEEAGGKSLAVLCDIREEEQVDNAIKSTVEAFGGIDIVINNASAISLTDTPNTPMKRYDLMNQVNARGTYMVSQKALPWLGHAAEMVWEARCLHHCQIRHVHVRSGNGGRISQAQDRRQCLVAADRDRYRRCKKCHRRRSHGTHVPTA